jgi:hypothetical protein
MMIPIRGSARFIARLAGSTCIFAGLAIGQSSPSAPVRRVAFDSPEGWALKYFSAATLMSGLPPPETTLEREGAGALTIGIETGWLPALSPERARVGFGGNKEEDLNKAPVLIRPSVRVGLPWRLSVIAAGLPPFTVFGVKPRLYALALERPILDRERWRLGVRGYGQTGTVEGAFTCPERVLGFPAGSPGNPSGCIGKSADVATLRYAGAELQVAHRIRRVPRLTPHAAMGVNVVHGKFQVNAPRETRFDRTLLWTRGLTFNWSAGVSYLLTHRLGFTVDAFYSPLWVRREAGASRTNDGLFNVRALLSYRIL